MENVKKKNTRHKLHSLYLGNRTHLGLASLADDDADQPVNSTRPALAVVRGGRLAVGVVDVVVAPASLDVTGPVRRACGDGQVARLAHQRALGGPLAFLRRLGYEQTARERAATIQMAANEGQHGGKKVSIRVDRKKKETKDVHVHQQTYLAVSTSSLLLVPIFPGSSS